MVRYRDLLGLEFNPADLPVARQIQVSEAIIGRILAELEHDTLVRLGDVRWEIEDVAYELEQATMRRAVEAADRLDANRYAMQLLP